MDLRKEIQVQNLVEESLVVGSQMQVVRSPLVGILVDQKHRLRMDMLQIRDAVVDSLAVADNLAVEFHTAAGDFPVVAGDLEVAGSLLEVAGELPEVAGDLPEVAGDLPEVAGDLPEVARVHNLERVYFPDCSVEEYQLVKL